MIKSILSIVFACLMVILIGFGWGVAIYDDDNYYDSFGFYLKYANNEIIYFTNTPIDKRDTKILSKENKDSLRHNREKPNTTIPASYLEIIYSKSDKYRIEPSLVSAVIKVESNWDIKAVSRNGAMGLMQLMPSTAKEMAVKNPLDPKENIEGGIRYLRYLMDRFNDDLTLALAAYNAGPRKVEKYKGIPPIIETRQYVKRVLSIYNGENPSYSVPPPQI